MARQRLFPVALCAGKSDPGHWIRLLFLALLISPEVFVTRSATAIASSKGPIAMYVFSRSDDLLFADRAAHFTRSCSYRTASLLAMSIGAITYLVSAFT